jgi:copper(I)-binding protein
MRAILRGVLVGLAVLGAGVPASAQHAPGAMQGGAPASYQAGSLVIATPWIRATPKGAPVAGGYLTITNNGAEPDRLTGGSLAAAARFEVHEMAMQNGVMRMRPLTAGVEIKPGETVEFKPGGYHVMFMGLKRQLTAGETVTGTLEFAKAGKVEISYPVRPMGGGRQSGH